MSQNTFRYQMGALIPAMFFFSMIIPYKNKRVQYSAPFWYQWPDFGHLAHRLILYRTAKDDNGFQLELTIMDFNWNLLTRCGKTYLRSFLSWIALRATAGTQQFDLRGGGTPGSTIQDERIGTTLSLSSQTLPLFAKE